MGLRTEVISWKSKEKQEIKDIYISSFFKGDRMPFSLMLMMGKMWHTEFLPFHENELLRGFVYLAPIGNL